MADWKKIESVKIENIAQMHFLSGVDYEPTDVQKFGGEFEHANSMRFVLDGMIYVAVEDPSDGYRSSLGDLFIVDGPEVKNCFQPVLLGARYLTKRDTPYNSDVCEIFQLVVPGTETVVLEVGTDSTNDYYPSCVMWFDPKPLGDLPFASTVAATFSDRLERSIRFRKRDEGRRRA